MSEIFAAVLAETRRFREALPNLLESHEGSWVVFKNGQIASAHASQDEAYRAGLATFGPYSPHVIDRVERKSAVLMSAAHAYC
ncbi:MAG: hypothetical protein VX223_05715 [Myxococcota bacterium]|nr:hypothetical protein [Myxococcota bacterium]